MNKTYIKRKQNKRRRKTRKLRGGFLEGWFGKPVEGNANAKAASNAKAEANANTSNPATKPFWKFW